MCYYYSPSQWFMLGPSWSPHYIPVGTRNMHVWRPWPFTSSPWPAAGVTQIWPCKLCTLFLHFLPDYYKILVMTLYVTWTLTCRRTEDTFKIYCIIIIRVIHEAVHNVGGCTGYSACGRTGLIIRLPKYMYVLFMHV